MTDEEMAEERATKFTDINFNEPDNYGSAKEVGHFSYCAGFLAGLEAGRPKWHDLRKNPDDLPTDRYFKITSDGDIALYDWFLGKWYDLRSCELTYQPGAWCEIPKFEEEPE